MPLLETKGAGSAQGFGEFTVSGPKNYIEDVFSTYLYTGTGATQAITNGIDLAVKGGLVWIKKRNGATPQCLFDTVRGVNNSLQTNNGNATSTQSNSLTAFNSTGFSLGSDPNLNVNDSYQSIYASWTFREQPKFFDVVTYTGDGTNNRSILHNLGSEPGFIILKSVSTTGTWTCYHRSLGTGKFIDLNSTGGASTNASAFPTVSSTSFVPTSNNASYAYNTNGTTYIAYLFAHNAGGFGLTGTDNVISCGSFNLPSYTNVSVELGFEPQFLLVKNTSTNDNWRMMDVMRGMPVPTALTAMFYADTTNSEDSGTANQAYPTATGFIWNGSSGWGYTGNLIYIAIRRGPMKVPTSGTSVFSPISSNASNGAPLTTGFPVDMQIQKFLAGSGDNFVIDRLRGVSTEPNSQQGNNLITNSTGAESSTYQLSKGWNSTGFLIPGIWANVQALYLSFRRSPSFFDEVCYGGTGVTRTVSHNLGVVPEIIIIKRRDSPASWAVWGPNLGTASLGFYSLLLNFTAAKDDYGDFPSVPPTSNVFTVGIYGGTNAGSGTYVAYLFATCAGVSKVGSYTGTGTTKQVDCGFTGGARFVLIKRTDSTGDWYVWDSARGIVAGNDPYLLLNSNFAQVTNTDYVDTYSAGFEISSTAPAGINASGGTFIFLAIA